MAFRSLCCQNNWLTQGLYREIKKFPLSFFYKFVICKLKEGSEYRELAKSFEGVGPDEGCKEGGRDFKIPVSL
jgi:hypothetical protein